MPTQREALIDELKIIRKFGVHRLDELLDELPALSQLATATRGAGATADVDRMMRQAWEMYADGPVGEAVGILLGLAKNCRGVTPAELRKDAAKVLHYSTDGFRKKPEHNAIAHLADVLLRYATNTDVHEATGSDRVDHIMLLIGRLTISEFINLKAELRELSVGLEQGSDRRYLDVVLERR